MTNTNLQVIKPVSKKERIKELDIIRGFALFGVLLVNMAMFNSTLFIEAIEGSALSSPLELTNFADKFGAFFIKIVGEGKFYTIFSFLFGLGFYIFMGRAEMKGFSSKKLFLRRSFFLLLFGVLHFSLVWYGDILHTYAIIAFLLVCFRNKGLKSIKKWIIILLIVSTLLMSLGMLLNDLSSEALSPKTYKEQMDTMESLAKESINLYQDGSFFEIVRYRVTVEWPRMLMSLIVIIPKILAMFLIGLYVGKRKIFNDITGNMPLIKRTWKIGGIIGGIATVIYTFIELSIISIDPILSSGVVTFFKEIATVFLSLFYITSLILLYRKNIFKKILNPLRYLGQMSLTNYLVQCILCSLIFYGHGLGLINKIGISVGILLTFVIYFSQIIISKLWLGKFRYGPFEWIWRRLTYGRRL
ncbi:DUF418 domain-containing protein [Dethiothermospora halolimnae]|uniref:DUF418 domain-containing protein n=1 Tax=Dethiothermospora halolimnae TaxID=3114390 RepID=UPI003CCBC200